MNDAAVRAITVGLLAAVGVYCASRLELTTSILHFLPSREDAELVKLSLDLVESPLARRMVLTIGGGPERNAAADALADVLRSHPEVAWAHSRLDEDTTRALFELYFGRRIYMAADAPLSEIPAMFETDALRESALGLRARLRGPTSILASQTAAEDPLGLFERILGRIGTAFPGGAIDGGAFASADGAYAVVLVGLRSSPFDSRRQEALLRDIDTAFTQVAAAHSGPLVLEQSGVNRIAIASEKSVRRDINLISAVAITGVCILFLLVFRSPKNLFIAALPPLSGFAVATAVALTFAAPIHGITLGFGFVLIGIAIDYPIHVMNHCALSPTRTSPREAVARIRASLFLSAATTTLAFLAIALSEFPGLREMGLFAAVGVPVALAVTLISVPAFLTAESSPTPTQAVLSDAFVGFVGWLAERPRVAVAIPVAFALVGGIGLLRVHWEDDPASLMVMDPRLLAEDEMVRRRAIDLEGGRFVVTVGPDQEAVLELNDRVHQRLKTAVEAGHVAGMQSLHSFVWSRKLQLANLEAFRSVPDLGARIERAFSASGFRPGALHPFSEAVASPSAPPLVPGDLVGSPLERALDSLTQLEGRWAAVTYLHQVRSGDHLREAIADLKGAHYVDQREIIEDLYRGYRRSALRMVALGAALVLLVLQIRYRSSGRGLLALLPSALVALTTLGIFGLFDVPVNVVSAIALVVVLGMGVDYGVFAVDGARDPDRLGATMCSLFVSCLTTLLVFGSLGWSEQPALRAIGLTAGVGIVLALSISPAVFVLARRGAAR